MDIAELQPSRAKPSRGMHAVMTTPRRAPADGGADEGRARFESRRLGPLAVPSQVGFVVAFRATQVLRGLMFQTRTRLQPLPCCRYDMSRRSFSRACSTVLPAGCRFSRRACPLRPRCRSPDRSNILLKRLDSRQSVFASEFPATSTLCSRVRTTWSTCLDPSGTLRPFQIRWVLWVVQLSPSSPCIVFCRRA